LTKGATFDPISVLNDRLSNYPVPPCSKSPSVSPQFQEIIYRALERNPRNRYSTTRDVVFDLSNQQQVAIKDRVELRNWQKRRSPTPVMLLDVLRALAPVSALALLLHFLAG
jgi:serine/threonine-protein kinase